MIYDLLMWLIDSLMLLWFFRAMSTSDGDTSRKWKALPVLAALLPVYLFHAFIPQVFRYLFRWFMVFSYLKLAWRHSCSCCAYCSMLFTSALAAMQSIQPLTEIFLPNNTPAIKLVNLLFEFVGLTTVSHFIPFNQFQRVRPVQPAIIGIVTVLILYSKRTTVMVMRGDLSVSAEIMLYPMMLLLLSLILLATFDRLIALSKEKQQQFLVDLSRNYQYENLQAQLAAQEDVRRIYHDMKNHLLLLETMSNNQQRDYIKDILAETNSYGSLFDTGSKTLDGLLLAKFLDAKNRGVHLSANIDLTSINYLEPIDVCAIFGNAIDNAVEASEKLPNPVDRFVEIKSGPFADQLAIRVINSYAEGTVQLINDQMIESTKADRAHHGIGLSSIRRSVEKYGGVLSLRTTPNHRLLLSILLPRSSESQQKGNGR